MSSPADPRLVTFGCRVNVYESEVMRSHARAAGLSDAIIVNTCAVTKEAERQARQTIRRLRRENPSLRIIATGCAVQLNPKSYAAMKEIDRILTNAEKLQAKAWLFEEQAPDSIEEDFGASHHLLAAFEGRTRAFVPVQHGCDHRCTFCIIPLARGPSRSVALGPLVAQIETLLANGYREIVLTGVDITAYGADLPGQPSLGQTIRRLLRAVPGLERLRLTSLDPIEIDADLMDLFGDDARLMPHVHLSVQHGADLILKRMKRRHLRGDVVSLCDALRRRRPDMTFGADLIAGFPTETEKHCDETLSLIGEAGLTHLHVFPFSPRPETPAAKMPPVEPILVKERAARVRAKGDAAYAGWLARQIGTIDAVLFETETKGHSDHYSEVRLDRPVLPGTVLPVRMTGVVGKVLQGEPAP